jgi:hypothetical protein
VNVGSQGSTLDIGGTAAANLTVQQLDFSSSFALTINFGVGNGGSDLLSIPSSNTFLNANSALFNFAAIGTVTTGTNYALITGPGLTTSPFGFSQAASAAGWSGSFSVQGNTLDVNFSSVPGAVPEPGGCLLVFVGIAGILAGVRKKGWG